MVAFTGYWVIQLIVSQFLRVLSFERPQHEFVMDVSFLTYSAQFVRYLWFTVNFNCGQGVDIMHKLKEEQKKQGRNKEAQIKNGRTEEEKNKVAEAKKKQARQN